jgi:hypothetical protein
MNPMDIAKSSILRLLPGKHTAKSIILTVKKIYPLIETQLTYKPKMYELNSNERWDLCDLNNDELSDTKQYYLRYMRLPHIPLTDHEVDKWIVTLLTSGKCLTKNNLTKEEIHRKCTIYAMRIYPSIISQEYIDSRLQSLTDRCYCKLNEKDNIYYYIP